MGRGETLGDLGRLTTPEPEITHDWRVKELREIADQAAEAGMRHGFIEDVLEAAVDLIVKRDDSIGPAPVPIGFHLGTNEHYPDPSEHEEDDDGEE